MANRKSGKEQVEMTDTESMLEEMRAELARVNGELEQAKSTKATRAPRTPREPRAAAAPKAARTLGDVIASQATSPRPYVLQLIARQVLSRVAVGQDQATALTEVLTEYGNVAGAMFEYLNANPEEGRDKGIANFLKANYPASVSWQHTKGDAGAGSNGATEPVESEAEAVAID